jgi:hypothetical protein
MLPCTPKRRKELCELSFQTPITAAARLKEWCGFDILDGLDEDERAFVQRIFNRRHLFTHSGGRVDAEYLEKSGDTSVRLNEVVRVSSKEVRRIISLVNKMASNLLDAYDSIS